MAVCSSSATSAPAVGADAVMNAWAPGIHDSTMSQCGANRIVGKYPRPGFQIWSKSSVSESNVGSLKHRDAGAAPGVGGASVRHALLQRPPERRAREHRREVGGVPTREEHERGVVERADNLGVVGIGTGPERRGDGRDAERRVVRETLVDPALIHVVALAGGRGREDQRPPVPTAEQPPVHVVVPGLELPRSQERVVAHPRASSIALPNPGNERSTMSSFAVTEIRNHPGVSNMRPGSTKTSWARSSSANRSSSSRGDRTKM